MIEGKNIVLRKPVEEDLEIIYDITRNYRQIGEFISPSFPSLSNMKRNFQERGYWEDFDGNSFLITNREDVLLGEIGYFKGLPYTEGYEIGYQIFNSEDRGKGYMTEALKIMTAYLFELEPIPRIQINIDSKNKASCRVAEKCGYIHEGTMRKALYCRGEYHDLKLFSMLREESPSLKIILET